MSQTLYDPKYRRLRIRNFIDEAGIEQEIRLPLCSTIDDTSLTNSSTLNRYEYQANKYKNTYIKRISRQSPITIKGIITNDFDAQTEIEGIFEEGYVFKSIDYYIYALNHLLPTVIYSFDYITGTMDIDSVTIDSYGKARNFEIKGYRTC